MPLSLEDRIRTGCLFLQNSFEKAFLNSGMNTVYIRGLKMELAELQEDRKEPGIYQHSWIESHQQDHDEEG
ncbi:hypothetical protein HNY73_019089 [Argiope bruennichi]|uniref:Uncharacterized protein n=1 Tax=Argiope bruennichi TaxID=94029 RepID=A0A8T0EFR4_ARGBR|nr:hypothetical protein HNY73_019089 [Argiope bruennichi]